MWSYRINKKLIYKNTCLIKKIQLTTHPKYSTYNRIKLHLGKWIPKPQTIRNHRYYWKMRSHRCRNEKRLKESQKLTRLSTLERIRSENAVPHRTTIENRNRSNLRPIPPLPMFLLSQFHFELSETSDKSGFCASYFSKRRR